MERGAKGGRVEGWKGGRAVVENDFLDVPLFLTPNMFVFVVAFFYTCAHYKRSRQKKM